MVISVSRVPNEKLLQDKALSTEQHKSAQNAIANCKLKQYNRYSSSTKYNGSLSNSDIKKHIQLDKSAEQLLNSAAEKLALSARAYFKLIKVARTIADLDQSEGIEANHIAEAIQYRQTS